MYYREKSSKFYRGNGRQNRGFIVEYRGPFHPGISLCLCHYRYGHLTVVQYLVEKCSADVNLKGNGGRTLLHDACR